MASLQKAVVVCRGEPSHVSESECTPFSKELGVGTCIVYLLVACSGHIPVFRILWRAEVKTKTQNQGRCRLWSHHTGEAVSLNVELWEC